MDANEKGPEGGSSLFVVVVAERLNRGYFDEGKSKGDDDDATVEEDATAEEESSRARFTLDADEEDEDDFWGCGDDANDVRSTLMLMPSARSAGLAMN